MADGCIETMPGTLGRRLPNVLRPHWEHHERRSWKTSGGSFSTSPVRSRQEIRLLRATKRFTKPCFQLPQGKVFRPPPRLP